VDKSDSPKQKAEYFVKRNFMSDLHFDFYLISQMN